MHTNLKLSAVVTAALLVGAVAGTVWAGRAETMEQARTLAVSTGKPILLEFNHDDCIHCQQAVRELDSLPQVQKELDRAVVLRLSVLQGEGSALSETYKVGMSFPVFILTNSGGKIITRWTGYTGADRFLAFFNQALKEPLTVDERVARCQNLPTSIDLQFLANYYTDTREYVQALTALRDLQKLQKDVNLDNRIFKLTAEAVWTSLLPYDTLVAAAEAMLANRAGNAPYFGEMALTLANVARRVGKTNHLTKYLQAAIEVTASRKDQPGIDLHRDLLADYALHSLNDTTESLRVKRLALGEGWENDPARCFRFGEWCLRHNINLVEAEQRVRMATAKAVGDRPRASHLTVLAQICYARGNVDEAIRLADQALGLDPSMVWFEKKLDEWRTSRK